MIQQIEVSVMIDDETNSVYVKFAGFDDNDEAADYAEYLINYLPVMLFESEVVH